MRPRNTLFLLLVLLALGGYVYWVELPSQKREAEAKKLVALDKATVTGVTLTYPDHTIALVKNPDGHWRLTQPVSADADDAVVNNLVTAVAEADVSRSLDDVGDKLASYGLAPPDATVALTLKDGKPFPAIKVGKTTQVGNAAYVQKGDDPKVYIGTAAFQSGMKKDVKDVRDKSMMTFEDQDVQKLELAKASTAITVERVDADRWRITAPASYPADPAEIRALLASLRGVRAEDFVTDDPGADLGKFELMAPQLKLSVWIGKDRAQKTLLIGGVKEEDKKKSLYAKRAELPSVVTLPEYTLKNLDKSLTTLRDKTVVAFAKDQAAKIAVTRKDGAGFTLTKQDGAWHVVEPGEGTERGPTITHFLDDVASFKGTDIVAEGTQPDLGTFGLNAPELTIAVSDADGKPLGTLIGARGPKPTGDPDAIAYVAATGGGVVYSVKPFVYDRIDKKLADFREKPRPTSSPSVAGPSPAAPAPAAVGAPAGNTGAAADPADDDDDDANGEVDDGDNQ